MRDLRAGASEVSDGKVGLAAIAGLTGTGDRKLRVELIVFVASAIAPVAPGFDEEALDEGTFRLRFPAQFAVSPVGEALSKWFVLAAQFVIGELICELGLKKVAVEQWLEAIRGSLPGAPSIGPRRFTPRIAHRYFWYADLHRSLSPSEFLMPRAGDARNHVVDMSDTEEQLGLELGVEAASSTYAPNLSEICEDLAAILLSARSGGEVSPWDERTLRYNKIVFVQMTRWLPDAESAQLCFEFRQEVERIEQLLAA